MFFSLDPGPGINALVMRYKREIRELAGEQLFLNDPPHLTAYLAAFERQEVVLPTTAKLAAKLSAIEIQVIGWHVFTSDPLTGGNTLVFQLSERSQTELRIFQQRLIEEFAPLRDRSATISHYLRQFHKLSQQRRDSIEECGFPFTGADWHPHYTVASIRPSDWPNVASQVLKRVPTISEQCGALTVYGLEREEPVAVASYPLRMREAAA
jgi:2'-5' RNA ligase